MDLNGKNAVVTGGIGGIGLAIAKHLLKNGIQVNEGNFKNKLIKLKLSRKC